MKKKTKLKKKTFWVSAIVKTKNITSLFLNCLNTE